MDKVYASLPLTGPADIRVLEVFPTEPGKPIETRLRVLSLDDNDCHFQALSYTWGDPTNKKAIRCNGEEFLATKNMYSALERLPNLDKSASLGRVFWIDAICINQDDWNERGSQVQLMLRIYQQADIVWADLGYASSEEFHGVAKFINLMIEILDVNSGGPKLEKDLTGAYPDIDDPLWRTWQEFLSRPYFVRLWTVQEFAFARELWYVYGESAIPWRVPYTIISCMNQAGIGESQRIIGRSGSSLLTQTATLGAQGATRLHSCRDQVILNGAGRGLPYMLRMSRRCLATDPKDKIFAVLGMTRGFDCAQPGMNISYDPTESVAEVYTRVAQCMLAAGADFTADLLHEAGTVNEDRLAELPSWVPDWSKRRATAPLLNRNDAPESTFAANQLPLTASLLTDGRKLQVKAAFVDVVDKKTRAHDMDTSKQHTNAEIWTRQHRWLKDAMNLHEEVSKLEFTVEPADQTEAFWRTLVADMTYTRAAAPAVYDCAFSNVVRRAKLIDTALEKLRPGEELSLDVILGDNLSSEDVENWANISNNSQHFRLSMNMIMAWRSFLVTRAGHYGLAHKSVEVGDSIVLIAGMDAPFIMRPSKDIDGGWILMCECYVHGYMKGEACENADWRDVILV